MMVSSEAKRRAIENNKSGRNLRMLANLKHLEVVFTEQVRRQASHSIE